MEILNQKQYIGHARHEGPFQENSLELYHYLVEQLSYKNDICLYDFIGELFY